MTARWVASLHREHDRLVVPHARARLVRAALRRPEPRLPAHRPARRRHAGGRGGRREDAAPGLPRRAARVPRRRRQVTLSVRLAERSAAPSWPAPAARHSASSASATGLLGGHRAGQRAAGHRGAPADRADGRAAAADPVRGHRPEARGAIAEVLAATLLTGTARRDRVAIDTDLALVGGELGAGSTRSGSSIGGNALASGLDTLLDVLADALTGAAYRDEEVGGERARLVERIAVARSQPSVIAREALQRHRYGDHPFTREMPEAADVATVTVDEVRAMHRDSVLPRGSVLVFVGDVDAGRRRSRRSAPRWPAGRPSAARWSCRSCRTWSAATCCSCRGRGRCSRSCGCPRRHPAHRPALPGAAAGEPGVRRVLLVAAGGEHP